MARGTADPSKRRNAKSGAGKPRGLRLDLPAPGRSPRAEELARAFKTLAARNAKVPARRSPRPNTGPFASEKEALDAVVGRLVEGLRPEEVWLFGSRARGDHRPDSDFDVVVVTRGGRADDDYERAYAPVRGLGIGVDVVPYRLDDFVRAAKDPTTIAGRAVREGKKIYASRQSRRPAATHAGGVSRSEAAGKDLSAPGGLPGVPGR